MLLKIKILMFYTIFATLKKKEILNRFVFVNSAPNINQNMQKVKIVTIGQNKILYHFLEMQKILKRLKMMECMQLLNTK
jgi:hypothetical protein